MESGPRALGARSILMSPNRAENKDLLNVRVKYREAFRPFCPSIAAECAGDYLMRARPERFMTTSFEVQDGKRHDIPAVVHVDGSVRPQTVDRESNPSYWDVIDAFGSLTGEHAILNTSFNIRGEPIICHPRDAIRAAVTRLPELYREVVVLRYFNELSVDEIAGVLARPSSTIGVQLLRARQLLRKALAEPGV